jgi:transcriptional regulator with XRE-family HTH domain
VQKPKPINWIAVRAEYEAGGISLRQLAQKIGVSRSTIERRSSKEGWASSEGDVKAEVKAEVSLKVRNNIVEQRVNSALNDLDIIDSVIASTYQAIRENPDSFKTSGEAIAALDKMLKIKLEYSDEHIQKWLLDKGYVAVPISEFAPSIKMGEIETTTKE